MKLFFRLFGIWLLLGCGPLLWAQVAGPKIDRVDIKYVGPASVSEQFVRSNIRLKAGDVYTPDATAADIRSLYATGQFYNIRVSLNQAADGGVIVTYIVQVRPRLTDIKIEGNKQLSTSKIRKEITVKVGQPLDEEKLFTDCQAIQQLYEKYGYAGTKVKYSVDVDENAGTGTATFHITEKPKVKIVKIEFIGAKAFSQRKLRGQIKTKERWIFSWLTGSDVFKQDQFDDDKDALIAFYRSHGYLDFEIKDIQFAHPTPHTMVIKFFVFEGKQYKVGSVKFIGNKIFNDEQIYKGLEQVHASEHARGKIGPHGLPMDMGDTFTPDGLEKDMQAIADFYGSKGYIHVQPGPNLEALQIPNVTTGTMDLEFRIDEGQKYYVERINIRGNIKTKDKVIRRELAIDPGQVFDMVRVKISKERLEQMQYFSRVDMEPAPTHPPIAGHENLDVNVTEQNTGKIMVGAGFSSVDSLVGFAQIEQDNFDLFHPPYFTGGGERARLFMQVGSQRQDYDLNFYQPWLFDRRLALNVDIYRDDWAFESPNNIYDETRTGASASLTRALWSEFLTGTIGYTIEDVGISLNSGWHDIQTGLGGPSGTTPTIFPANVPDPILQQNGDHLFHRFNASLAYDTRNNVEYPNGGQRTEFDPEFVTGDSTYYKLKLKSEWFFRGLFKSHVIQLSGRVGVADGLGGNTVPFYDSFYLGGLYSLRGFKYRNIAPREAGFTGVTEPIGGDSYWFASVDYYIPIIQEANGVNLRLDLFYDAGSVSAQAYSFSGPFDDDAGLGFLLNIPHLGPLQLYYGIPINHDQYNSGSGKFQFGFGYSRPF